MILNPSRFKILLVVLIFVTVLTAGCSTTPVQPGVSDISAQKPPVFNVSTVSINPQGPIVPGTPVKVSFLVGVTGFPAVDDLEFDTDLDNPKWTYSVVVGGGDNPQPTEKTKTFSIVGFEISYIRELPLVIVNMTLEGTTPITNQTTTVTIFRVTEIDTNGHPILNTRIERTTQITDVDHASFKIQTRLGALRSKFDAKTAQGFETSAAERKYADAGQYFAAAKKMPSSEFMTAFNNLHAADEAITVGEQSLDAIVNGSYGTRSLSR